MDLFLGLPKETPKLKNGLVFCSGTNRPLSYTARAQDITLIRVEHLPRGEQSHLYNFGL